MNKSSKTKTRVYVVDFDDLCDNTVAELDVLRGLKAKYPNFKATLFAIPKRCNDETINKVRACNVEAGHMWLQLAPHGWRHTRGECLSWTETETYDKLQMAYEMGIDARVFRAPAWLISSEVYDGCRMLGYAVASHAEFRVPETGVPEYVYNGPRLHKTRFKAIHGHLTPVMGNYIRELLDSNSLEFQEDAEFAFPQDIAEVLQ